MYLAVFTAGQKGKPLIEWCSYFVPTMTRQRYSSNRSHLIIIGHALSLHTGTGYSDLPAFLSYTVQTTSLTFHLAGDTPADDPIDFLAFSLVVCLAVQWKNSRQFLMPGSLFRIVAQDATLYFLVIFTSHLTLEMTIIFGGVRRLPHRTFPLIKTFIG